MLGGQELEACRVLGMGGSGGDMGEHAEWGSALTLAARMRSLTFLRNCFAVLGASAMALTLPSSPLGLHPAGGKMVTRLTSAASSNLLRSPSVNLGTDFFAIFSCTDDLPVYPWDFYGATPC